MLTADWNHKEGWGAPRIHEYGDITLSPSALVLHYGLECFEGMKAYHGQDGEVRLFRPWLNVKRFNKSSVRFAMPTVDEDQFMACLKDLVNLDRAWIPKERGYSMYLRPTMIATTPFLGVAPPQDARLMILQSPVGAYYDGGFKPIRILADEYHVRSW